MLVKPGFLTKVAPKSDNKGYTNDKTLWPHPVRIAQC